jgi:uncharacterized protein YjlB
MATGSVETYRVDGDGSIPNSELMLLIYRGVDEVGGDAAGCESLFDRNRWWRFWRDGIYSFHHFHSTAHEALGWSRAAVVLGGR